MQIPGSFKFRLDKGIQHSLSVPGEPAPENMDAQGAFAIYEKEDSTYLNYKIISLCPMPSGRRLGNKVEFRETGADSYKLFVHAKGDGTEHNPVEFI